MQKMIWNAEKECLTRHEYREIQLERLKHIVGYCYENVPFYTKKFDQIGLKPRHIQTLKDIEKIPFTIKNDLRDNYPFGLFANPMSKIVRLHASSGTTGKPIVIGYTKNDMKMWTESVSRIAAAAGVTGEDVAQIVFGYGMFTGGFGLHYGLENMGVTVIPSSSGNSVRQIMFLQDFKPTVIVGTPSYVLHLSEIAEENGLTRDKHSLRVGLFGGEGHTDGMREEIEKRWGIEVTENYGLTEIMGPGVSGECLEHTGMHINEDYFYPEIINSETGEARAVGEIGELVMTTLTKEGVPMLRYRTKDITSLSEEPCHCGRTNVRMSKITGRTDDMMIIRGVNVFPSQIENVLLGMEHIGPHYMIILTKKNFMDAIEIQVELNDSSLIENYRELEQLESEIRRNIKSALLIDSKITLLEPKSIERSQGKAKRVIDLRDK
jgi:phenylacetate-CoA ligase